MDRPIRDYPSGELRVSDADRDRALAELSEAFQAGRITADELDQRSGQVLSARTGRELTAPLADLPCDRAPAMRAPALERAHRVFAARLAFAAGAPAFCCATVAVGHALNHGPSRQQLEQLRQMTARLGLPVPPANLPSPGFDWVGTITPGTVAVLLVVLIMYLRARRAPASGRG
jgi:hypothetical protein